MPKTLSGWKQSLLALLLKWLGLGYLVVLHGLSPNMDENQHDGCTLWTSDDADHLAAILKSTIECCPEVRKIVWDSLMAYLRRYEVDSKNFVQELYAK